ncbi:MAG: DNA repair protein RecO [Ruthenibacterium sp.]
MQITTMGLVLRATKTGEADRILSVLTPDKGILSAVAKGSLRLKSKLFSGTGLFCYSEFTLFEGKTMYVVDEASVQNVFFGLHEDVESMALAMYFSEIAAILSPEGEEAQSQLKLLLNSLYFLSEKKRPPRLMKAIYELRALSLAGYMPNLVACADCVKYDGGSFYFNPATALLYCENCAAKHDFTCNLDAAALDAMRHIVFASDEKLFSFTLSQQSTALLSNVMGQYRNYCLERPMKSLSFLETVLGEN